MYSNNDWRDYQKKNSDDSLAHSWGTSPQQKAREREYNHDYWERNRERIMAARQRARDAIGITARENQQRAMENLQEANRKASYRVNALDRAAGYYYDTRTDEDRDAMREARYDLGVARDAEDRAYQRFQEAARAYDRTPLGKAEAVLEDISYDVSNAVDKALDSIKNLAVSALGSLSDLIKR